MLSRTVARALSLLAVAALCRVARGAEVAMEGAQMSLRGASPATFSSEVSTDNVFQLKPSSKGRAEHPLSEFSEEDSTRSQVYCAGSSENRVSMNIKSRAPIDIKEVDGRNVEFIFNAKGNVYKSVVLCGSWTAWRERYSLTSDSSREKWRVTIPSIPDGTQHFKFIVDNRWTTSDDYSEMLDGRAIPNNVIRIVPTEVSSPKQPQQQQQHLRCANIANIGSDVSEEEVNEIPTSPQKVPVEHPPPTESEDLTGEIRNVPGPDVEFTFPADGLVYGNVTLCGSWSNWKDHFNLTRDGVGSDLRVMVRGIPPGLHHFKFIIDGLWTTTTAYSKRRDSGGNINNVLRVSDEPAPVQADPAAVKHEGRPEVHKPAGLLHTLVRILTCSTSSHD